MVHDLQVKGFAFSTHSGQDMLQVISTSGLLQGERSLSEQSIPRFDYTLSV